MPEGHVVDAVCNGQYRRGGRGVVVCLFYSASGSCLSGQTAGTDIGCAVDVRIHAPYCAGWRSRVGPVSPVECQLPRGDWLPSLPLASPSFATPPKISQHCPVPPDSPSLAPLNRFIYYCEGLPYLTYLSMRESAINTSGRLSQSES